MSILSDIWCVVSNLHRYFLYAIYSTINAVVSGLESIAQAAINALPEMDEPTLLSGLTLPGGATMEKPLGWLNYVVNVPELFEVIQWCGITVLVLYLARIPLRWVKAES